MKALSKLLQYSCERHQAAVPSFLAAQLLLLVMLNSITTTLSATTATSVIAPTCTAALVRDIQARYHDPDISNKAEAITDLLEHFYAECLNAEYVKLRPLYALVPNLILEFVQYIGQQFTQSTGISLEFVGVELNQLTEAMVYNLERNVQTLYDVFMYDASGVIDLANVDAFEDLGSFVVNDPTLQWHDILPYLRDHTAVYDGKIIGIPANALLDLMFYRRDVFAAYNLTVPHTWEDLLTVAKKMNGTDFNEDGIPDYSICLPMQEGSCVSSLLLAKILSSMTQYQGFGQGYLFDPMTMNPLVDNPAMAQALELYRQLSGYAVQDSLCDAIIDSYNTGACMIAIKASHTFKSYQFNPLVNYTRFTRGVTGVAQLPGSARVLDRGTNQLVPCTPNRCPFNDNITSIDGSQQYVNRCPNNGFGGGVYAVGISKQTDPAYKQAGFTELSYFAGPQVGWMLDVANRPLWLSQGWEAQDLEEFLSSIKKAMESGNLALPLILPDAAGYRDTMNAVLTRFMAGQLDIANAMSEMRAKFESILGVGSKRCEVQQAYWRLLKFTPPPGPASAPPVPSFPLPPTNIHGQRLNAFSKILLGVLLVMGILALVAVVVICHRRVWRYQRRLSLHKHGPGAGPLTTLLVTDIMDSTILWEATDTEVMDVALKLHHETIRRVAKSNGGYESATEGDAFILAFHNADDAIHFAVECQHALLHCPWPEQLLKMPACQPVWMDKASSSIVPTFLTTTMAQPTKRAFMSRGRGFSILCRMPDCLSFLWTKPSAASADPTHTQPGFLDGCSKLFSACCVPRTSPSVRDDSNGQLSASNFVLFDHELAQGGAPTYTTTSFGPLPSPPQANTSKGIDLSSGILGASLSDMLQSLWRAASSTPAMPGASLLVYAGLRVRMGAHTGIAAEDVVAKNAVTRRIAYHGAALKMAKAVGDACPAGALLLSETAYKAVEEALGMGVTILHRGEYAFKEGPMNLYQVQSHSLLPRLAHMPALRKLPPPTQPCILTAPVHAACIVFMHMVGAQMLLQWNAALAKEAIQLYRQVITQRLIEMGGYLVEADEDGLVLAAFVDPVAAVRWSLECIAQLKEADWNPDLLRHELCEEITMEQHIPPSSMPLRITSSMVSLTSCPSQPPMEPSLSAREPIESSPSVRIPKSTGNVCDSPMVAPSMHDDCAQVSGVCSPCELVLTLPPDPLAINPLDLQYHQAQPVQATMLSTSANAATVSAVTMCTDEDGNSRNANHMSYALAPVLPHGSPLQQKPAEAPQNQRVPSSRLLPRATQPCTVDDFASSTATGLCNQSRLATARPPGYLLSPQLPTPFCTVALRQTPTLSIELMDPQNSNEVAEGSCPKSQVNGLPQSQTYHHDASPTLKAEATQVKTKETESSTATATANPAQHATYHARGKPSQCKLLLSHHDVPVTLTRIFRGPRVKVGLDVGPVKAHVDAMTRRMVYRGKVMNRASRIANAAKSGQVWCSDKVYGVCAVAARRADTGFELVALGELALKGLPEPVPLFHCLPTGMHADRIE